MVFHRNNILLVSTRVGRLQFFRKYYDPWWNLAVQNQATDRAHRIGQTRTVNVVKMIATDTIEEKIIQLQEAKREMADAIMSGEGTSLASLTKEELLELVR